MFRMGNRNDFSNHPAGYDSWDDWRENGMSEEDRDRDRRKRGIIDAEFRVVDDVSTSDVQRHGEPHEGTGTTRSDEAGATRYRGNFQPVVIEPPKEKAGQETAREALARLDDWILRQIAQCWNIPEDIISGE